MKAPSNNVGPAQLEGGRRAAPEGAAYSAPTHCSKCGEAFEPADVVLEFVYAPERARRQVVRGLRDRNGHTFVDAASARVAHARAFNGPPSAFRFARDVLERVIDATFSVVSSPLQHARALQVDVSVALIHAVAESIHELAFKIEPAASRPTATSRPMRPGTDQTADGSPRVVPIKWNLDAAQRVARPMASTPMLSFTQP